MSKIIITTAYCLFFIGIPVELLRAEVSVRGEVFVRGGSGSTWSLKDDGKEPGVDWMKPAFDDSRWRRGAGPFGYGESGITTEVTPGGDGESVRTTTYFRTTFDVVSADDFEQLLLTVRADDGYVAYLNGNELHRWNMPSGEVTSGTYAVRWQSDPVEDLFQQFSLTSRHLVSGNNVLAIELHQGGKASSDLYLDLALAGISKNTGGRSRVSVDAQGVTRLFNNAHFIGPDIQIPDGFVDGGRNMHIDEFRYVTSRRELILIDRRIDDRLRDHLRYARSDELQKLNEVDRATRIARYIDRVFTPQEGRGASENRVRVYIDKQYASQEVLLGNVSRLCGAGVCRHRSLLFKLMADEAGLNATLVRGNLGADESNTGGHAWNELILSNGRKVVVEVMNPQPDFYFPAIGEPSLRHYRTVANHPKY